MIPTRLKQAKGWLLWRLEPNEDPNKKPRKVPCYVDGTRRHGEQGSAKDRRHLATYEAAASVLDDDLAGAWVGLGFALLPDFGIVGLDFDHCVVDGRVDSSVISVIGATYSEFSPSGTGVHAFLSGSLPDKKSHAKDWGFGFEVFHSKGFLTMTGQETDVSELAFSGNLDHVNGAVSELFAARFGSSDIVLGTVAAPRGVGEPVLRALMARIPADGSYEEWIRRGMALHHESGAQEWGLALWDDHSRPGATYPGLDELRKHWRSFGRRDGGSAVTIATLESMAALDPDMFDVVSEVDLTGPAALLVSKVASSMTTPVRRGIPEAHHLCTDQANAGRLVNAYGKQVLVAAGRWHVWDGRRWIADEADVYRYACKLSALIHDEAKGVRARAQRDGVSQEDRKKADGIAKALEAWAVKSEMKGSIEAAVGLAKKMLTVEVDVLDRDPWALNCLNGIVDLRTGGLRAHDPDALITKLVPVAYVADATAPTWERALAQITQGDADVLAFLQRWAGYCLTGSVVEQCFVVHWGGGSNGKSTVLDLLADTMGDYADVAAPGLMTAAKGERHPTEIASLMGRRMVTAHESGEGVVLREDFIKQATGGDRLSARFMREDFFSFAPTHKLQLLTNHKPSVKGQDQGIWRRVLLVPYEASFGSAAQVATGERTAVADLGLVERLRGELEGILAWRVRGAVDWGSGGLRAPPVVRAASDEYKREQDRVGQFISECCEVGKEFSEPLTAGLEGRDGLYPEYVDWCRTGGVFPVSKTKFMDDVLRVANGIVEKSRVPVGNGRRREVRVIRGLKLLDD